MLTDESISPSVSYFRSFLWLMIVASGWIYSTKVIIENYQKFKTYPYENKPTTNLEDKSNLEFPKVTICPNGMHSIEKLTREYKDLNRMAYGNGFSYFYSNSGGKKYGTLILLEKSSECPIFEPLL